MNYFEKLSAETDRVDDIKEILNIIINKKDIEFPLHHAYNIEDTFQYRVNGDAVRKEAAKLLEIMGNKIGDQKNFDLWNLKILIEDHTDILLHNYAINISHRSDDPGDMDKIRNWLIHGSLLNHLACPTSAWYIPEGWKMKDGEAAKIVICVIEERKWENHVRVKFSNGEEKVLFSYYNDELSFRSEEFIGLTEKEALDLFYKKDAAFLMS